MKKLLFAIFAHPDDEAFGPAGTLLLETRAGTELHLITLTDGASGENPDHHADLSQVRLDEWRRSGEVLGASSMHHLGYHDGHLGNIDMQTATTHVLELIQTAADAQTEDYEIELLSFDTNGVTGHIDHIIASRIAHYVYYTLRHASAPVTRLRLACLSQKATGSKPNLDFVYMEPGRPPEEVDEIVDARHLAEEVYAIIRCHRTQRADGESKITQFGEEIALDYFVIK